jgi:16S rRNA (cytosine1402-N4)-methyltransferase
MSTYHTSVLLKESISALNIQESGIYIDATLGGGGHSKEILSHLGKNGRLMVFDKDSDALNNAPKDKRVIVVHNNFRFIHNFVKFYGFDGVDGILADLGVSSHQFDTSERGFSFRFDTPLDMRMNILSDKSARDIINNYREEDLARIFKLYGEVENSKKVANLICTARAKAPIMNTSDLAKAIEKVLPSTSEHKFLAKIYQALRIEVNGEMSSLEYFLRGAQKSLNPGGKLSIITYHSLEDRMVKNFLKSGSIDGNIESDIYGNKKAPLRAINKKPALPAEEEIASNTRARSAKLRIGEKVNG